MLGVSHTHRAHVFGCALLIHVAPFAAVQQIGRFWSEADVNRKANALDRLRLTVQRG